MKSIFSAEALIAAWVLLFLCSIGAAEEGGRNVPRLIPQHVSLSKAERWSAQDIRHLVIMVSNEGVTYFPNKVNPVTVLINGKSYEANIFAKIEESARFLKWVHIPARSIGALIIDLPAAEAEQRWRQCDKLVITLDPEQRVWGGKMAPISLRLHKEEYASGCGHLPG